AKFSCLHNWRGRDDGPDSVVMAILAYARTAISLSKAPWSATLAAQEASVLPLAHDLPVPHLVHVDVLLLAAISLRHVEIRDNWPSQHPLRQRKVSVLRALE